GAATMSLTELALRRVWQLASIGALLALLGVVGSLVAQTATAFSVPFPQAIGDRMLSVALGTRFGLLWWTRLILLLALSGVVLVGRRSPAQPVLLRIGGLLSLAVLLVYALGTHAAAVPDSTPAAVGLDWLHLVAVMIWVGGLGYLGLTAWTLARSAPQ